MFTILFNLESLEGEAISLREHMRSQSNNFFRDLEATLANAVRLGQLPQGLDLQRAATLLHCTLDGYIINWLHFPERIDLRQEADFLLDSLFALIAQPTSPAPVAPEPARPNTGGPGPAQTTPHSLPSPFIPLAPRRQIGSSLL